MPSALSESTVTVVASLCAMRGSVKTITRRAPSRRISYPTSRVTPGPYLMLDVSIENAVSFGMALLPLS